MNYLYFPGIEYWDGLVIWDLGFG